MAINKVNYGGTTLIDTSGDTADPADVILGQTFHSKSGAQMTGTMENIPGIIKMFAGTFAPTGWLLCNGAEVAIEDYPALYDVIQDTYGTASDSDHFVLPDLRGRMPLGSSNSHLLASTGGSEYLQNHAHSGTYTRPTVSSSGAVTNGITGGSHSHRVGYNSVNRNSGSTGTRQVMGTSATTHVSSETETHTHNLPNHTHTLTGGGYTVNGVQTTDHGTLATGDAGNMPPFLTINYIISTGGVSRWADSAGLPIVRDVTLNGQSVVNNEIAQLPTGAIKRAWLANDKSTTSGTYTEVCHIELEAGVWVLNWGVRFAANATGQRVGNITTSSGANSYDIAVPAHGGTTQIRTASILSPNQTTTYYLNAMQNSGSALNLSASGSGYGNFINAVRIV